MAILGLFLLASDAILLASFTKISGFAENLLLFFTFFYGLAIGILTLLGLIGSISQIAFFLILLAIFAICASFALIKKNNIRFHISALPRISPFMVASGTLAVSYLLVGAFVQKSLPPITTDGLYYHLPFAARWFQTGALSPVPLFFSDIGMTYYPVAGDLIYLVHFLLFGSDVLVNLVQMPFAIYAACALYLILRCADISRDSAFFGACALVLARPIFRQTTFVFVDLMFAAFFLATVRYFLAAGRTKIIPACINAGMLIGTKTLGIVFFVAQLPLLARRWKKIDRRTVCVFLAGVLCFLILGWWSYINCWRMTGNPVYPARVIAGPLHLEGIYRFPHETLIEKLHHMIEVIRSPYASVDAPLILFSILSFIWLVGIIHAWQNKLFLYFMLLPLILFFLYVLLFPTYYYQMRHLLVLYGPLMAGTAVCLGKLEDRTTGKIGNCAMFLILLALAENANPGLLTVLSLAVFALLGLLAYGMLLAHRRTVKKVCAVASGIVFFVFACLFFSGSGGYRNSRMALFKLFYGSQADVWNAVSSYNDGARKVVAYAGDFFIYPFHGTNLENYVYYQPVNRVEETPLHLYPVPPGMSFSPTDIQSIEMIYRSDPDFGTWMKGLHAHNVALLAVRKRRPVPLVEEAWADSSTAFILIFENSFGKVYAVKTAF
jgi:hypothetical protein